MNKESILEFLDAFGSENVREDGAWIRCSCPLAPFYHLNGTDDHPSFGVHVQDDSQSGWWCFSCNLGGNLKKLLHLYGFASREYPYEANKAIWDHEIFDDEDNAAERIVVKLKRHKDLLVPPESTPVPSDVIVRYPFISPHSPEADWLMSVRKISWQTIAHFRLRSYLTSDGRVGIIFPIYKNDQVVDMWVRLCGEKRFFRLNASLTGSDIEYKATHLCFGSQLHNVNSKPLWLVEAPLDLLTLWDFGVRNVRATCGPPTEARINELYTPSGIVLGFDADNSGDRFSTFVRQKLADWTSVYRVHWSTVGGKRESIPAKDANDIAGEAEKFQVVCRSATRLSKI
jgi:hypothetical protein